MAEPDDIMGSLNFPNPKIGPAIQPMDQWYRYYAGYSARFVEYTMAEMAPRAGCILDPWNGTGTTTMLAARSMLSSYGFDANPALVMVAKARLLHSGVSGSINALATDIVAHAGKIDIPEDPLRLWFSNAAAAHIRGLQLRTHRLLVGTDESASGPADCAEAISTLAAFFYTVLFRTVRLLVAPAGGTNPTWWKARPANAKLKARRDTIMRVFKDVAAELADGLQGQDLSDTVDVTLGVADSRALPLDDGSVDGVVSSPPYCTRIDYAVSTRPELAVLRYSDAAFASLRNVMVGTPTMTSEAAAPPSIGPSGEAFLAAVGAHDSKASGGYYLKYYRQYYAAMSRSLAEIRRVLRAGAPCVLVVQDTYYKELRNDTPGILLEMAEAAGFQWGARQDFAVPRTKASMNPKARAYRASSAATESVLVLR